MYVIKNENKIHIRRFRYFDNSSKLGRKHWFKNLEDNHMEELSFNYRYDIRKFTGKKLYELTKTCQFFPIRVSRRINSIKKRFQEHPNSIISLHHYIQIYPLIFLKSGEFKDYTLNRYSYNNIQNLIPNDWNIYDYEEMLNYFENHTSEKYEDCKNEIDRRNRKAIDEDEDYVFGLMHIFYEKQITDSMMNILSNSIIL